MNSIKKKNKKFISIKPDDLVTNFYHNNSTSNFEM